MLRICLCVTRISAIYDFTLNVITFIVMAAAAPMAEVEAATGHLIGDSTAFSIQPSKITNHLYSRWEIFPYEPHKTGHYHQ